MADYTYTDDDWRENAKYGLFGVTADDATAHWDRWLAAHDAKVRAETLREAASRADEWRAANGMHGGEWFPSEWAGQVAGWLEHRADQIEKEAGL